MNASFRQIFSILSVVLMGLFSVVLSEVTMVTWLNNAPFDAISEFFWNALLPTQLIVVGITSFILLAVYRKNPRLYLPLYALVYATAHGVELNFLNNPLEDITLYLSAIACACAIWFSLLWQAFLKLRRNTP